MAHYKDIGIGFHANLQGSEEEIAEVFYDLYKECLKRFKLDRKKFCVEIVEYISSIHTEVGMFLFRCDEKNEKKDLDRIEISVNIDIVNKFINEKKRLSLKNFILKEEHREKTSVIYSLIEMTLGERLFINL